MDKDYTEYFTDIGDKITGLEAEIYIAADNYKSSNKDLRKSSALYQKDAFIHGAKWVLNYLMKQKTKHMTRTISYNTENTEDMLWALKRVYDDIFAYDKQLTDQIRTAANETIKRLTESVKNL